MVLIKYNGIKIKLMKGKYSFDWISFCYSRNIIIYFNDSVNKNDLKNILHKSIKKARR